MKRWFVWTWLSVVLFGFASILGVPEDVPCFDDSWYYSDVGGKCYKFIGKNQLINFEEASKACAQSLSDRSQQFVRLVQFRGESELQSLIEIMLHMGNMEAIWLGAHRTAEQKEFRWQNTSEVVSFPYLEWSGGTGIGQCLQLSYLTTAEPTAANWKANVNLQEADCDEKTTFLCEHEVPICTRPPGGFNESSMTFAPSKPFPRKVVKAICKEGSYMSPTGSQQPVNGRDVNDTLKVNEYYCDGQRAVTVNGGADPLQYKPSFKYSGHTMTECLRLQCPLYPNLLANVENAPTLPEGSTYIMKDFGDEITFNCSSGYVSSQNQSSILSTMKCSQSEPGSNEGIWIPEHYQVCVAVRCDLTELRNMIPRNGILSSARNYLTDRVYTQHQVNEFNYYGNVIVFRCNPGYLFPDRTLEKTVSCTLEEASQTDGVYKGYGGTVLPLPPACEETTCMYENAVIKPEYHMKPYFLVQNGSGDWKNMTKHEGQPYALGAMIRYFCEEDYETVNQNADFNITCSDTGMWSPQLIGCIAKTADLPSSSSGRFQTEPEEAKSAKEISSIMFILIFIFLGLVVLLDLTTVGRDAKQLWSNVKLQRARLHRKSHKRRENGSSAYGGSNKETFPTVRNRNG